MQKSRAHPLFSSFGCGAALFLIVALAAILLFQGGGPFSPGEVTAMTLPNSNTPGEFRSHAEFEQDCAQCPAPWRGITAGFGRGGSFSASSIRHPLPMEYHTHPPGVNG